MIFTFILLKSIGPIIVYDNQLYYAQTIKWIENYPAIPGLGNLHTRLAFNSSWYVLSALFGFSFLKPGYFYDLNGLLGILLTIYSIKNLKLLVNDQFSISKLIRALYPIAIFLIFENFLVDPSNDFPVAVLGWIIFDRFLEKIENSTTDVFDQDSLLILILSIFAFTVKISILPIFIIPAYLVLIQLFKKRFKMMASLIVFSIIIISPFFIRSIIQSGYLIFPVYQVDLFNVDWKVPKELNISVPGHYILSAKASAESAISWARIPFLWKDEVLAMSFDEWRTRWFNSLIYQYKAILFLIFFGVVYFLMNLFSLKKENLWNEKNTYTGYIVLFISLFSGIAFWFLNAPDFRFGYSFLLFMIIFFISYFVKSIVVKISMGYKTIHFMIIFLYAYFSINSSAKIESLGTYLTSYFRLPSDQSVASLKKIDDKYSDKYIFYPIESEVCGYSELLCTPYINPYIEFRGNDVKDGFRVSSTKRHFDIP